MEIKYLEVVRNNPRINRFVNEPMTITEIEALEQIYNEGNKFPQAFREYLFLAGNFNNFTFDDLGEGLDGLQKMAYEELDSTEQKVDRPFFAFDVYNSQYSVIFLDETKEDPEVFLISPYLAKEGSQPLIKPTNWIFSKLVAEGVRRKKYNIPL